jgi:uncharacterized membrane protein
MRFGFSSWIIVLNVILIFLLMAILLYKPYEYFVNYPQQINPLEVQKSNPEAITANNNYASILMYIQKNPDSSVKFISDIKQKFFNDSCTVKDNIDFKSIAKMPLGMPFS